jgi:signal transduction histidine kinase
LPKRSGPPPLSAESDVALAHLAALERLNKIINGFASMVSHETRSALVGIQGLSELIRDGGLSEDEVHACADDIFTEAQKINGLIGQMFDLGQLENGRPEFRKVHVDVNDLVTEVVNHSGAKGKRVSIEVELDSRRPAVSGDPDRLHQAVDDVFDFALRTAKAASRITVATRSEPGLAHVGIRSSSLALFEFNDWLYGHYERYEQRPSAIIGAGLGLAIARAILELHGGRIGVESAAQTGTEFTLTLPAL